MIISILTRKCSWRASDQNWSHSWKHWPSILLYLYRKIIRRCWQCLSNVCRSPVFSYSCWCTEWVSETSKSLYPLIQVLVFIIFQFLGAIALSAITPSRPCRSPWNWILKFICVLLPLFASINFLKNAKQVRFFTTHFDWSILLVHRWRTTRLAWVFPLRNGLVRHRSHVFHLGFRLPTAQLVTWHSNVHRINARYRNRFIV